MRRVGSPHFTPPHPHAPHPLKKLAELAALRQTMAALSPKAAWTRDVVLVAINKCEQEINTMRK